LFFWVTRHVRRASSVGKTLHARWRKKRAGVGACRFRSPAPPSLFFSWVGVCMRDGWLGWMMIPNQETGIVYHASRSPADPARGAESERGERQKSGKNITTAFLVDIFNVASFPPARLHLRVIRRPRARPLVVAYAIHATPFFAHAHRRAASSRAYGRCEKERRR
jgi:hypothetical protein